MSLHTFGGARISRSIVSAAHSGVLTKGTSLTPINKSDSSPHRRTTQKGKPAGIYKLTLQEQICIAIAKSDTTTLHNLCPDLTPAQIDSMIKAFD